MLKTQLFTLPVGRQSVAIIPMAGGFLEIRIGTNPPILFDEHAPLVDCIHQLTSYGLVPKDVAYIISKIVGII